MKTKLLHTAVLLLGVIVSGYCQQHEFVFTHLTKDDRLSSNHVVDILVDHHGYNWFSTANGLQRYDGKRMMTFFHNPNDPNSLPDNSTGFLFEDNQKRIWIWTGPGPTVYDPLHNNFTLFPIAFKKEGDFYEGSAIMQDSKGTIWLTLYNGGLFYFDEVSRVFNPYTRKWPKLKGIIRQIAEDVQTGNYWLATDSGLILYNSSKMQYYSNAYNPEKLNCFTKDFFSQSITGFHKDKFNNLWISFWPAKGVKRFVKYITDKDSVIEIPATISNTGKFFMDNSGNTWAVGEELAWYDKNQNRFLSVPKKRNSVIGIDFDIASNICEDNEHNIWVSTDKGAYVFNPGKQKFFTREVFSQVLKKNADANINGFVQTKEGIIALGWGFDGLYFFDSIFNRLPNLYGYQPDKKDPAFNMTWCGLQDSNGLIWIGCQAGHLLLIDPKTNSIKKMIVPQFTEKTVRSITEDDSGNLWFGTQNTVIVKWIRKTNNWVQVMPPPKGEYHLNLISSILKGDDHDMWVASSSKGLLRMDQETGRILEQYIPNASIPHSIRSTSVLKIIRLDKQNLALATVGGLEIFDLSEHIFRLPNETEALTSQFITNLEKDNDNNLWFSTNDGLSKLQVKDHFVVSYGLKEGIYDDNFSLGSITPLKNGMMAIATSRGFLFFKPDQVQSNTAPPEVSITGIRIFDTPLPVDSIFNKESVLELNYHQNFLSIQFSAMSFLMNDKLDYYYMLQGIDNQWVKADLFRQASYTHLPGGTYSFKVRAVSKEGIPGENITTMKIRIIPPFWDRWWFYLLVTIAATGIIYYVHRTRLDRVLDMEKVRRRIARDLHDDMGSTLSTINILSEMAKMQMDKDRIKTKDYISKISENSLRMMEAMDDIVWSINPMNDSMQKITARMREFSTGVLEAKNIDVSFQVDEAVNDLTMDMEQRRDFFLLFKEAVNNLAKYSHAKHASIRIFIDHSRLFLCIEDDGIGFDVEAADSGNGLTNMKKRAESLEGHLIIKSEPGNGTQVMLVEALT